MLLLRWLLSHTRMRVRAGEISEDQLRAAAYLGELQSAANGSSAAVLFWAYRTLGPQLPAPSLVAVWAQVEGVEQATLRLPDGDREVSRIRLTDNSGLPWVATVTATVPETLAIGDWIKVVGAFTKLWPNLTVISCWTDGPSAMFSASG